MLMQKKLSLLAALILTFTLSGCGLFDAKVDETQAWSASKLYSEASEELNSANYERAIQLYEKLESRYPFGTYAQQAQMQVAYAHYKSGDAVQALASVERFIKLHPNHPNIDYIYYLRGLINFNDKTDLLNFLVNQDPTERDPKATREAFDAFKQLVDKFPDSKYTPDAISRMKYLVNAIGQYEVHVAKFYYRRGAYVAALNRAQTTVTQYRDAVAVEEALYVMSQCYDKLAMPELRDDTLRVFNKSFPNSKFGKVAAKQSDKKWWQFW
jgi:outer membrane protein assembly factor BamD